MVTIKPQVGRDFASAQIAKSRVVERVEEAFLVETITGTVVFINEAVAEGYRFQVRIVAYEETNHFRTDDDVL